MIKPHVLPKEEPYVTGPVGAAWKFKMEAIVRKSPRPHASLESWIVYAPWAHPWWHSYAIMPIHLRPVATLPSLKIYLEGATHEFTLWAMDPDWHGRLDEMPSRFMLQPKNFAAQFVADSDAAASARISYAVVEILDGILSPDTDYSQQWIARFGANMFKRGVDKSRIGETVVMTAIEKLVIDPKAPDSKPDTKGYRYTNHQ